MKKALEIIIFVLVIAAILTYWPSIKNLYSKARILSKTITNNEVVSGLKQSISIPPPLRGVENNPKSQLTPYGVISMTNVQRQQNGQPVLQENSELDQAAKLKLDDMFKNQYFEHVSPSGAGPADLAKKVSYEFIMVGENLALGNFTNDQALVVAWMQSPGHRENILNSKYREIGVAVGKGTFEGKTTWLAVQEFGEPVSDCPQVDNTLKAKIDAENSQAKTELAQIDAQKGALDAIKLETQADYSNYNRQAAAYNSLVNDYNAKVANIKKLVAEYNAQVQQFNACSGQ